MKDEALKKLEAGLADKAITDKHAAVMKKPVAEALMTFCRQDGEFAQAVVQGGSFKDCMAAVAKNCGSALSDLEAYRRAVQFYFPGADVRFEMRVDLEKCGAVVSSEDGPERERETEGRLRSVSSSSRREAARCEQAERDKCASVRDEESAPERQPAKRRLVLDLEDFL